MESNKYKYWMFTWNNENVVDYKSDIDLDQLEVFLKTFCDSYVFQVERESRTHIQGFFSSFSRKRKQTLLKLFEGVSSIKNLTIERMMGTKEEAYAYCTKTDTQIEAPRKFGFLMPYKASDLALFQSHDRWYPWQFVIWEKLLESSIYSSSIKITNPNDRTIIWVTDLYGNSGKSKFVKNICYKDNLNVCKLSFGSSAQLRSACISAGQKQIYFIDIPRTLGRDDSINDIISVVEDIKNGFVVTTMYGLHKQLLFEPPHVVIFANFDPPEEKLSSDRWDIYQICKDKNLTEKKNGFYSGIIGSHWAHCGHSKDDL